MSKKIKYGLIGAMIGLFIGVLPFISASFYDNPLEIIFALPLIPVAWVFGGEGHPPLALYLSPLFYPVIGLIIGMLFGALKK